MTRILAFDLGLNTGFYNGEEGGTIVSPKTNREFFFYNLVLDFLVTKRKGEKYDAIVYEEAQFQLGGAAYIFNGQRYILHLMAQTMRIPCIGIHSMTVKKNFAGSGKATKQDMMKVAKEYSELTDDNHADAIAVYHVYKKLNNVT